MLTLDEIISEIDLKMNTNGIGAITGAIGNYIVKLVLLFALPIRVVKPAKVLTIPLDRELHQVQDFYNKGQVIIEGGAAADDYGSGAAVPRYGIFRVDGILYNEGIIVNNGLIIN